MLMLAAEQAISGPEAEGCPEGHYYVRALGGYVLIPARYMPYAFELEAGMTGAYRSPSPPMSRRCAYEKVAISAGNIQTGTVDAIMQMPGKVPASKPKSKSRVGEFEITIWSIAGSDSSVPQWRTVLITRNDQAMRIFDADPELWRRVLDSYSD